MKDNVKRMKIQATDWREIFAKDISDKALLLKTYKELVKVNNKKKKKKTRLENWPKTLKDISALPYRWQIVYEKMLYLIYYQGNAN